MREGIRSKSTSKYLVLMIIFLLVVNLSLGYLLVRHAKSSIISLMHTRMLDISNTAAAMIDGDVLKSITADSEGTEGYESVKRTLTYFQDNIDLKYIYCVCDMGDGTFTFGLDPTVDDPGEFGSPIVYTDALYKASKGTPAADDKFYEDAWGSFYSAYSPVFDSKGNVAGIIAVDFSAEWFNEQLTIFTRTTLIVALLSLLVGGGIVISIITRSERKIGSIHGQLNELQSTLMQEMGNAPLSEGINHQGLDQGDDSVSIDDLGKQIQSMQSELKNQVAQVHGKVYKDGLTGVKSKQAYLKAEETLNEELRAGTLSEMAVVVCDVNGLKKINDTLGHKAGDDYIRKACEMICDIFNHSPVYRVGGDEFTALLRGRDYENRKVLMHELHKRSATHIMTHEAIVSGGMAEYIPDKDHCIQDIFDRADAMMYEEKTRLKDLGASTREEEPDMSGGKQEEDDISVINVRRHILIADDIETNREILKDLLQDDFDFFYAADGVETLKVLREHKDEIALVLLDLYMPNMTGQQVMKEMLADEELMSIPVIVLSVDQNAELECLKIGAMDFIPKPFPSAEIVKARIAKCIELSENRDLIRYTQKDKLTGLFNYNYFIRYVKRFDQQYKENAMDAVVCDIDQFRAINKQCGSQYGDLVLRNVGLSIKKLARKTGGIGCRQSGDVFMFYCLHQDNCEQLLQKVISEVNAEMKQENKVRLRFGVFVNAQQEPDIEERFSCAKIAADSIKDDPQKICGFYDFPTA